jgi:hypothetical protein
MLMIGVTPLPALMNRMRSGEGSQREAAFDSAQPHHRSRAQAPQQIRRDLPVLDQFRRDRDAAVGAPGVGGERVGAPVAHAVYLDTQTHVLPRAMPRPLPARLDQQRDRVGGLRFEAFDAAAQLTSRPQRIEQLQVVIGQQGRGERADHPQRAPPARWDDGDGAALSHGRRLRARECHSVRGSGRS